MSKKQNIIWIVCGIIIGTIISSITATLAATTLSSKNVYYDNSKSGGSSTNVSGAIDELYATADNQDILKKEIIDTIYPVGSIYITTKETKVSEVVARFGGSWEAYASGRTLVGVGSNGTTTYALNQTGGSETVSTSHTHSFSWSGTHAHYLPIYRRNADNYLFLPWNLGDGHTVPTTFASDGVYISNSVVTTISGSTTYSGLLRYHSGNATLTVSGNTQNGGNSIDVRQPYIAVYMYKRTG